MSYVSVIIVFVTECLQIKFCIFEYSREATISQVETFQKTDLGRKLHPTLQKTVGYLNGFFYVSEDYTSHYLLIYLLTYMASRGTFLQIR